MTLLELGLWVGLFAAMVVLFSLLAVCIMKVFIHIYDAIVWVACRAPWKRD
ncbi:hypothetical protein [Streptomyces sp. 5-10]|uniref:hypothetical protein n=1 Tax=Streptomyces sp. 5-10 TaxID=878925 RepID=UPI00168B6E26|nr:hypothetical protein [Streptomyces sp. 5-10]MBD3004669.1 hypothetical protein [Streptomyces sp. 5-10]